MKDVEQRLQDHFRRYYGVIGQREARRLGATDSLVRSRLRRRVWIRRHEGVYLLAAVAPSPSQELRAALVALPRAWASHLSAAWLLGLVERPPDLPHVTTADRHHHRLRGVVVHRTITTPPWLRVGGFPCTTATRTLVDLAASASPATVTHALDQALLLRHTAIPHLERALRTTERGRPGSAALRRQLAARGVTGSPEPSLLESHMDRLLERSGLPRAVPQHRVESGRYRLDYAWPEVGLAVEVKGYAWHSSPESLRADAQREREISRQGWTLLCFTWAEVTRQPDPVVAEIAAAYQRLTDPSARFSARRNNSRGKDAAWG